MLSLGQEFKSPLGHRVEPPRLSSRGGFVVDGVIGAVTPSLERSCVRSCSWAGRPW